MPPWTAALGEVNVEYASKRASACLHAPLLFVMRPGWSERACRREIADGRREAQHKWSALRSEWDDVSRTEVVHRSTVRELSGRCREPAREAC